MPDKALDADTDPAGCINYYDTDDYARDWADWVGVADLPNSASGGTSGRVGDQLLPTIFTIGFGLNYNDGQGVPGDPAQTVDCAEFTGDQYYQCQRGLLADPSFDRNSLRRPRQADYMGEELLRYIADVGDNFQIDNDYWQYNASIAPNTCNDPDTGKTNRLGNCIVPPPSTAQDWGPRGACEQESWTGTAWNSRGVNYLPKPPQESCGNYFWAATGQQLEEVFNQIASRMFTRLSQ